MRLRALATGVALLTVCAFTTGACSSSVKTAAPAPTTSTASLRRSTPAAHLTAACKRPHHAGQFAQSFSFAGQRRTYQLYVPPAYKGTNRVPLVFNFHGYGSNAVAQMVYGSFKPQADQHDFVIVAPDGQDGAGGRHYNLTNEQGLQNDIAMVQSLMTRIESMLCIDPSRVYSTGMSDGGAMTSVLACLLSNKIAAFAAVAVIIYCGSAKSRPVAIAAFSGTADPVVPFNGGAVHCCGGVVLGSAPGEMASWAAHDHCAKKFTDTRLGSEVRRRTWTGCTSGGAAVFYIIDGGGHTWPGAIPIPRLVLTTQQIDASNVIWKFFSAHELAS